MFRSLLCSAVLFAVSAAASAATIKTYSDQSGFGAVFVQDGNTVTLEDLFVGAGSQDYSSGSGLLSQLVNFQQFGDAPTDSLYAVRGSVPPYNWGTGAVLMLPGAAAAYTVITLPSPVTAVGFNVMTSKWAPGNIYTYGGTFNVTLSNGASTTCGTLQYPNAGWCGITSDTPFTSLTITTVNGRGILDNFQYGTANEVTETPEVATLMMIGTGLLALRAGSRYLRALA